MLSAEPSPTPASGNGDGRRPMTTDGKSAQTLEPANSSTFSGPFVTSDLVLRNGVKMPWVGFGTYRLNGPLSCSDSCECGSEIGISVSSILRLYIRMRATSEWGLTIGVGQLMTCPTGEKISSLPPRLDPARWAMIRSSRLAMILLKD